jgi:hypothetical protein
LDYLLPQAIALAFYAVLGTYDTRSGVYLVDIWQVLAPMVEKGRREKGEGRREKGEGRREKGEGRREKGEGRRQKQEGMR